MATAWPFTLPQCPISQTVSRQWQDNLVRGPADVGIGQLRRKASTNSQIVSFSMLMTAVQITTLDTFYNSTLGGGVYEFELKDPVSGVAKNYTFMEPYRVEHLATNNYRVSMVLISEAE